MVLTAAQSSEARTAPLLCGRNLVRRFGRTVAVDGVDITVSSGEILGLVGPNGSGKTTLLNLIAGNLRPHSGSMQLLGSDIAALAPYRRATLGIARCSQIVRPLTGMTVQEAVMVGALFGRDRPDRNTTTARRVAEEMLDRLGLASASNQPAVTLNIANRKRLELARAMAMDPVLLLLDELMAGLTPPEVDAMVASIHAIRAGGVAIVVVEHLMRAILRLCDRAVVLWQGRILAHGLPQCVLQDPEVVRAYLGTRRTRTG